MARGDSEMAAGESKPVGQNNKTPPSGEAVFSAAGFAHESGVNQASEASPGLAFVW